MKKLLLLLLVLPFIISSCRKEGCTDAVAENYDEKAKEDDGTCEYIDGCTDETATNYDEEASKDDGSCEYEGEVLLWTNCDLCCQVQVRIDGEYQGNTSVWYSATPDAPNCRATGCVSATLPVGSYEWSGTETCVGFIVTGTFVVSANECTKVLI